MGETMQSSEVELEHPTRSRRVALRKWSGRVVNATVVLLIIVALLIGYGLIDNRWYRIITVEGGSMSPTLEVGDAIVITPPPTEIEAGMILTLRIEGQLVTHRVIEVHDDGTFTTRGDASFAPDDFRGKKVDVVGIQRMRIPQLGKLLTMFVNVDE